jgi:hypothetical protein
MSIQTPTQEKRFRHKSSGMVVTNLIDSQPGRQFSSWTYYGVYKPGCIDRIFVDGAGVNDWEVVAPIAWRDASNGSVVENDNSALFITEPKHVPIWDLSELIGIIKTYEHQSAGSYEQVKVNQSTTQEEVLVDLNS